MRAQTMQPASGSAAVQTAGGDRASLSGASQAGIGGETCWHLVTCRLDREEVAFNILSVQEINRMVDITPVPKAPRFVEGVINLRGRIIPVLNLRRRLGIADGERTARSRIVVVNVHGRIVGLLVDSVSEVLRVPHSTIETPPALGEAPGAEFIQGVGRIQDRLVTLLDLNRLLAPDDLASPGPITERSDRDRPSGAPPGRAPGGHANDARGRRHTPA